MSERTALIYSSRFDTFSYGEFHPFNPLRFRLAFELISSYGLDQLGSAIYPEPPEFNEELLYSFHDRRYIERMKEFSCSDESRADFLYGLGDYENPVFQGFFDWACLGASGTCEAVRLVSEEGYSAALNLAGGYHHAHRAKASGFSYVNDAVIAIDTVVAKGKRVVYLDIDAHHGDGVQEAYYDSDQVLVISLHESGIYFFPGTGFENEIGEGCGRGYTVNIPLIAHTDDPLYMKAFDEAIYPLIAAFDPDLIVTQIGADTFRTDPLSRLEMTTHSYSYILRKIKALRIPWVALGGGGYDLMNTARAWTIAWGVMNGVHLPLELPELFIEKIRKLGFSNGKLLDAMHWADEADRENALLAVEKGVAAIRTNVFPIIIG